MCMHELKCFRYAVLINVNQKRFRLMQHKKGDKIMKTLVQIQDHEDFTASD
ncbi:uncharacterized protein DS421_10g293710 [Arachis hypogaea]|nr:uncharacterized protein DS421_10g293710 [Arachis hypogaea]